MIHRILILSVIYHTSTYLLFFKHYYHYTINNIILISLHRTAVPSRCLFFVIQNKIFIQNIVITATIYVYHSIPSHNFQQYGQTLCLRDRHTNMQVYCIYIRTTTVWFIASVCFSEQYRVTVSYSTTPCWQVSAVSSRFYSIQLLSWLISFRASIVSSWLP